MPRRAAAAPDPTFAERVIRWQAAHGRHDLPWQGSRDPYRIWLSEVMLQQTQVETVRRYYARFLARFPDVHALAAAPLDDVLALWSGMGYYSRARHLHRAAQHVVAAHGGQFPRDATGLERLPGVGRSTAAAVAAFAYGERAAILDGNVKRLLARATGFGADLAQPAELRRLWARAEALLPERDVAAYTQGLMDLGAAVCLPRTPRCEACPLAACCVAREQGRPQDYPVKSRRVQRGRRRHAWLWLAWRDRVWLGQRPAQGVWAGLWSLPEFPDLRTLEVALAGLPGRGEPLPVIEHALTHFDWTLEPLRWTLPARVSAADRVRAERVAGSGRWFDAEAALALGLPAPLRRLLAS